MDVRLWEGEFSKYKILAITIIRISQCRSLCNCKYVFFLSHTFNELSLEDKNGDSAQDGLNKASKGGLIYGDYLQVSLLILVK